MNRHFDGIDKRFTDQDKRVADLHQKIKNKNNQCLNGLQLQAPQSHVTVKADVIQDKKPCVRKGDAVPDERLGASRLLESMTIR